MLPVVPQSYNFHNEPADYIIDRCDGCDKAIMPREERWVAQVTMFTRSMTTRCGDCMSRLSALTAVAIVNQKFAQEQNAKKAKSAPARKRTSATERVYVPKADERCAATPVEDTGKSNVSTPPTYETIYGSE
jgi:hypothetical protein